MLDGGGNYQPQTTTALGFRPLPELISDALRERILKGEYRPGERLNISDIAKGFGVSHVPVREALRRLEAFGLVAYKPNRGAMVCALSKRELREVYAIRVPLEVLAATEAIHGAGPTELAALESLLKRMDQTPTEYVELHDEFHTAIHRMSGLPLLCEWLSLLRGRARPYILIFLNDFEQRKAAQIEHYAYVDALRRKDEAALRRLVPIHLARSAEVGDEVAREHALQSANREAAREIRTTARNR